MLISLMVVLSYQYGPDLVMVYANEVFLTISSFSLPSSQVPRGLQAPSAASRLSQASSGALGGGGGRGEAAGH